LAEKAAKEKEAYEHARHNEEEEKKKKEEEDKKKKEESKAKLAAKAAMFAGK